MPEVKGETQAELQQAKQQSEQQPPIKREGNGNAERADESSIEGQSDWNERQKEQSKEEEIQMSGTRSQTHSVAQKADAGEGVAAGSKEKLAKEEQNRFGGDDGDEGIIVGRETHARIRGHRLYRP